MLQPGLRGAGGAPYSTRRLGTDKKAWHAGQLMWPHLGAMLQLKLVEECPGIPQVRVNLHCAVEPLSSLGNLPLAPEEPVAGGQQDLEGRCTPAQAGTGSVTLGSHTCYGKA